MENKKSGVPGVSWDKKNNKWLSRIKIEGKIHYLGRYLNIEDAIRARKEAELKFGVDKDKYKKDLIGKNFGELTVLEFVDYTKQNSNWLCKCSCGKECVVSRVALIQGYNKTCGHGEDVKKAFESYKDKYLIDGANVALIKNEKLLKSNTSGVKGVSYAKRDNRWMASIEFKKKKYNLGTFINKEDAIKARKEAEERLHKDFLRKKGLID